MSSLKSHPYSVVDVFTTEPLAGNPLAVFPDAREFSGTIMQKIARELNLAETAFVLPASRQDCTARVRIFTPTREMTFAGHPTIGTAFVLMDEGIAPRNAKQFVLEEGVGPVPIQVEPGDRPLIWLTTPPISFGGSYDPPLCARLVGLDAKEDRKSTRLNSSHRSLSRMPSSA